MQLFLFTPEPSGRERALGFTLRVREPRRANWRHLMVKLYWPHPRNRLLRDRPPVALEAGTWLSTSNPNLRITVKTFIRIKVGIGGPWPGTWDHENKVLAQRAKERARRQRRALRRREEHA